MIDFLLSVFLVTIFVVLPLLVLCIAIFIVGPSIIRQVQDAFWEWRELFRKEKEE